MIVLSYRFLYVFEDSVSEERKRERERERERESDQSIELYPTTHPPTIFHHSLGNRFGMVVAESEGGGVTTARVFVIVKILWSGQFGAGMSIQI